MSTAVVKLSWSGGHRCSFRRAAVPDGLHTQIQRAATSQGCLGSKRAEHICSEQPAQPAQPARLLGHRGAILLAERRIAQRPPSGPGLCRQPGQPARPAIARAQG